MGAQDRQFFGRVADAGGQFRPRAAEFEAGQHAPGDDPVAGQRALQRRGGFEVARLGVAAGLEHAVPFFNAPAAAVPWHAFPGGCHGAAGPVAQEQPVDGFDAGGRVGFVGVDGLQGDGRPAFFAADLGRVEGDLAPAHFQSGGAGGGLSRTYSVRATGARPLQTV